MCILHIEPLFYYASRHPAQAVLVTTLQSYEKYKLCGHKIPTQRYYIVMQWAEGTMQCHVIVWDTTGTAYTFYEIEKTKGTKKNRKPRNEAKEKKKVKQNVDIIRAVRQSTARRYAVSRVDISAMPCHRTGYDRHGIHNLWRRENKGGKKRVSYFSSK